jgi:Protein of unknown function (DUF2757)
MRIAESHHTKRDESSLDGVVSVHVEYMCKHCQHKVGEVHQPSWTYADAENRLGIGQLTAAERMESVSYQSSGTMRVQTVCENCQQALEHNPELLVEGKLLQ